MDFIRFYECGGWSRLFHVWMSKSLQNLSNDVHPAETPINLNMLSSLISLHWALFG